MTIWGVITPPRRPNQHQAVINDAAFSTYVGEAAEYNSACVNTLRRSWTVINSPALERNLGAVSVNKREFDMNKILLSLFATVLLTACGTTGAVNLGKLNEPLPADKARIVVERDSSLLYLAAAVDVRSNGIKIASLGRGGSVVHNVSKGQNTLAVSTPTAFGQFVVSFDAKAGETYNFQVTPRGGALVTGSAWGMAGDAINASVSEQSGYFKIEPKGTGQ